ncbi:hypothetical protein P3T29_001967 [Kitasatospora sp. MAP5-34]|nr:hypothetical protein [Kitasatospora sp. MAP5-34]
MVGLVETAVRRAHRPGQGSGTSAASQWREAPFSGPGCFGNEVRLSKPSI